MPGFSFAPDTQIDLRVYLESTSKIRTTSGIPCVPTKSLI